MPVRRRTMRRIVAGACIGLFSFIFAGAIAEIGKPVVQMGPFGDVPSDHWAYDAVNELARRGVLNGFPDSTFQPNKPLTRAQFAVGFERLTQDFEHGLKDQNSALKIENERLKLAIEQLDKRVKELERPR
jgi:hypothetical protein